MPAVPDYWSYRYGYAVKGIERDVCDGVSLLEGPTLISVFIDTCSWRYGVIFDIVIVTHYSLSFPTIISRWKVRTLSLRSGG